jgi:DNA-directed RNA polymerase sigma subunit (sigma70/sigma32)
LPLWSCALAAADERPVTAEWVARCMGVTRARVAQIERQAISEVRSALEQLEP